MNRQHSGGRLVRREKLFNDWMRRKKKKKKKKKSLGQQHQHTCPAPAGSPFSVWRGNEYHLRPRGGFHPAREANGMNYWKRVRVRYIYFVLRHNLLLYSRHDDTSKKKENVGSLFILKEGKRGASTTSTARRCGAFRMRMRNGEDI